MVVWEAFRGYIYGTPSPSMLIPWKVRITFCNLRPRCARTCGRLLLTMYYDGAIDTSIADKAISSQWHPITRAHFSHHLCAVLSARMTKRKAYETTMALADLHSQDCDKLTYCSETKGLESRLEYDVGRIRWKYIA